MVLIFLRILKSPIFQSTSRYSSITPKSKIFQPCCRFGGAAAERSASCTAPRPLVQRMPSFCQRLPHCNQVVNHLKVVLCICRHRPAEVKLNQILWRWWLARRPKWAAPSLVIKVSETLTTTKPAWGIPHRDWFHRKRPDYRKIQKIRPWHEAPVLETTFSVLPEFIKSGPDIRPFTVTYGMCSVIFSFGEPFVPCMTTPSIT